MSGGLFIDTETTGIDAPEVIELAWLGPVVGPEFDLYHIQKARFRPSKPISLGALATHHILDEDLVDEPRWPGAWPLPEGTEYLIGHHVDFDWAAIGSPAVKRICTLALARYLWPEIDSHSLVAMAYKFGESREQIRLLVRGAHSAYVDISLLMIVMHGILDARPDLRDWSHVWALSELARIPTRFTFGKYGPQDGKPGRLITEIRREDPGYIEWCMYKCDICRDEYWQRALRGQI